VGVHSLSPLVCGRHTHTYTRTTTPILVGTTPTKDILLGGTTNTKEGSRRCAGGWALTHHKHMQQGMGALSAQPTE